MLRPWQRLLVAGGYAPAAGHDWLRAGAPLHSSSSRRLATDSAEPPAHTSTLPHVGPDDPEPPTQGGVAQDLRAAPAELSGASAPAPHRETDAHSSTAVFAAADSSTDDATAAAPAHSEAAQLVRASDAVEALLAAELGVDDGGGADAFSESHAASAQEAVDLDAAAAALAEAEADLEPVFAQGLHKAELVANTPYPPIAVPLRDPDEQAEADVSADALDLYSVSQQLFQESESELSQSVSTKMDKEAAATLDLLLGSLTRHGKRSTAQRVLRDTLLIIQEQMRKHRADA